MFPWKVALVQKLVMPPFQQGKLFVCTPGREGKLCPFKQMCELRRQGERVRPYTRANKTYQGELSCGGKLVHCTHEQVKLTRNLSRKTWSCVRGFFANIWIGVQFSNLWDRHVIIYVTSFQKRLRFKTILVIWSVFVIDLAFNVVKNLSKNLRLLSHRRLL